MIEHTVAANIVNRAQGTGFLVAGAVNQPPESGIDHRTDAHNAWLQRCVEGDVVKPIRVGGAGRLAKRKDFGVRGGVNECDGSIVGTCHNLAADHGDRTDGHLSLFGTLARFLQSKRHEIKVMRRVHFAVQQLINITLTFLITPTKID